jgi:hypothetical protein
VRGGLTYFETLRTLKAPVGVWFSCLTHTVKPRRSRSSGQAYCGVGGMTECTVCIALWT